MAGTRHNGKEVRTLTKQIAPKPAQAEEAALLTDRAAVRRAFHGAASAYDAAAVLQREIADRMLERLDLVKLTPSRMLDAGSGTGYAGPRLKERFKGGRLIELDIALGMLQAARSKSPLLSRFLGRSNDSVCADLEAIPLQNDSVELVWSNLAIQWLNEPDRAFREFHRILKPEGLLMFSTFGPDTLLELRQAFAAADNTPHVNRFIDMHDLGDALSRCGYAAPVMDMEKIVMTYDDVKAIMHDLKAIGATYAASGRRRGLLGKTAWARVIAAYEQQRRAGKLPASYEVIYGHAWKPSPKPVTKDGSQVISFRPRAL